MTIPLASLFEAMPNREFYGFGTYNQATGKFNTSPSSFTGDDGTQYTRWKPPASISITKIGLPIVVDSTGKQLPTPETWVPVNTGRAGELGIFDTATKKLVGTQWAPTGAQTASGNDHVYTDVDLSMSYQGSAGSQLPQSQSVFVLNPDGSARQLGAWTKGPQNLDWSTSNRNNYLYANYSDPALVKASAKALTVNNVSGMFVPTATYQDPKFGWSYSEHHGEQFGMGGLGGFGSILSIGLALATGGATAVGEMMGFEAGSVAAGAAGGALLGGVSSALTGGNILTGALVGAAGGAFGASDIGADLKNTIGTTLGTNNVVGTDYLGRNIVEVSSDIGQNAIDAGVNGAVKGASSAVLNGGSFSDILTSSATSALTSAAGAAATTATSEATGNNVLSSAAGGGAAGVTHAALTGGDVVTEGLVGAGVGAVGGVVKDATGSSTLASGAQTIASTVIPAIINSNNSASGSGGTVATTPAPAPTPTPTTPGSTTPGTSSLASMTFADSLSPVFAPAPRANMQWGSRLSSMPGA